MPLFGPPDIAKLQAKRDVAALIKLLAHKDASLRARAAEALGTLRAPEAVAPLIAALTDADREVVRPAARGALAAIGAPAVAPLIAALGPPLPPDQRAQLEALIGPEDRAAANPQVSWTDAGLRRYHEIVAALAATGAPAVTPMCALVRDAHDGNRATAVTVLAGILAVEDRLAAPHGDTYDSKCDIHSDAGIGVTL